MSTWRDSIAPRVGHILANAKAEAIDARATRKRIRCPYKGGWLAQVWYDECRMVAFAVRARAARLTCPASVP